MKTAWDFQQFVCLFPFPHQCALMANLSLIESMYLYPPPTPKSETHLHVDKYVNIAVRRQRIDSELDCGFLPPIMVTLSRFSCIFVEKCSDDRTYMTASMTLWTSGHCGVLVSRVPAHETIYQFSTAEVVLSLAIVIQLANGTGDFHTIVNPFAFLQK